jgi:large subunit ribosomal protein L25
MKTQPLKARRRTEKGTRQCRKLRRSGEIPVNLYGSKISQGATALENNELAASAYDVMQLIAKHAALLEVSFEKRKELAVLREVQRDPMGDDVVHVDLVMVDANRPIELPVELAIKGDAKGARRGGRVLAEMRTVTVRALPAKIPQEIVVRVDDLDIDQDLKVKDLQLPEGVTVTNDPDMIVVHVLKPISEAELLAQQTSAAAAAGEPEIIGKKKEEGEEGAEGAAPAAAPAKEKAPAKKE